MDWFFLTTVAYFLLSLEIVFNKFLLASRRISHPVVYAFYSAALGLFTFFFIPFGFHLISPLDFFWRVFAGMIFIFGMLSLFFALSKSEASRVTPVVGAVIPVVIFFLSVFFLGEELMPKSMAGIILLIFGGILISFDFSQRRTSRFFSGFRWSILAGIFLAVSATMLKSFYSGDNFINVFIWTRLGALLGVASFFFVPSWRKKIFSSLSNFKSPQKEHKRSGMFFLLAKTFGGVGSFLKEKATSLSFASVTVVNALVSMEYVFVYALGIAFSLWIPHVFEEKKDWKHVFQKLSGIVLITLGVMFVSFS